VPEAVAFECNGEKTGTICSKAVENCIDQADNHAQKLYEVCPAFIFFAHRADSPLSALASPVFRVMGNARYLTISPPVPLYVRHPQPQTCAADPKPSTWCQNLEPGFETLNLVEG